MYNYKSFKEEVNYNAKQHLDFWDKHYPVWSKKIAAIENKLFKKLKIG